LRRFLALVAGVATALQVFIVPAVAVTAPITITADAPASVPAGHNWTFNDFVPRNLSVHQGQTIELAVAGFHTVTLLPAGMTPTAGLRTMGLVQADNDDTTRNVNGTTHTLLNIGAGFPVPGGCGAIATPCSFDGTAPVSTGAPLAGPVAPLDVSVNAPVGTYRFICLVHPKMKGSLNVVANSIPATTSTQAAQRTTREITADLAEGWAAEKAANVHRSFMDDGVRTWIMSAGTGTPDGRVAIDEMLPANQRIRPGDRVRWIARSVNEIHTVTFPTELHTDMVPLCEAGSVDTLAFPTVIPPTGPQDFSCGGPPVEFENGAGNGVRHVTSPATVADSGVIASDSTSDSLGLPDSAFHGSWSASFRGAAHVTYSYVFHNHAGIEATITVH
jgi:plastocyanin